MAGKRQKTSSTTRTRRTLTTLLAVALVALIARFAYDVWQSRQPVGPGSGQLEIHALDVGQGDGFLILTPGGKAVLIDAGPPEAADRVLDALAQEGVQHIDLVVATHPHADHIGGLLKVLDTVPVRLFLDSGQAHPTRVYTRLLEKIREKGIRFITAESGQEFDLDEGITLRLLAPIKPFIKESRGSVVNANSIVCRLTYGSFSMLFTGDSEQETEERMLNSYPAFSATVLKVAHHGSKYATGAAFLERVHPQVAIISCGAENEYGHPAQVTLDRLRTFVSDVYRTDLQGEITIYTDGTSYTIETEHVASGDLWAGRESHRAGTGRRSRSTAAGAGR